MKYRFLAITAAVCAVILSGCSSDKSKHEAYAIKTFEENPYLAEVWWGDGYDENTAKEQLAAAFANGDINTAASQPEGGACSSWHKGNFHGRNIDWNMKDYSSIVVHMPRNEAGGVKYASVSIITGIPFLNKDFIEQNKVIPEKLYSLLPIMAIDGMNECGVAVNHNIVPYDDKPYIEEGEMAAHIVPRFVLDHFATAKEAVDSLSKMTVSQGLPKKCGDYSHFMISDPTSSYVVEWIDSVFIATEFKADGEGNYISQNGQPAIMTNYFVAMADKYGLGTRDFFLNHPFAEGVERAQTIMSQLPEAETVEDHLNICKSVWYKKYCQGKTDWYSEQFCFAGIDSEKGKAYWFYPTKDDIHYMDNDDIYAAEKACLESPEFQAYFNDFNTNWDKCDAANPYWYTQHSVVYDLKNLKGYLVMQEGMFSDKVVELSVE